MFSSKSVVPQQQSPPCPLSMNVRPKRSKRDHSMVVAAVGDLSADSNNYLIAGAAVVALIGTGFPILFSRKDTFVIY